MVYYKLKWVEKISPKCRFDTLPVVRFDKLKGSLISLAFLPHFKISANKKIIRTLENRAGFSSPIFILQEGTAVESGY